MKITAMQISALFASKGSAIFRTAARRSRIEVHFGDGPVEVQRCRAKTKAQATGKAPPFRTDAHALQFAPEDETRERTLKASRHRIRSRCFAAHHRRRHFCGTSVPRPQSWGSHFYVAHKHIAVDASGNFNSFARVGESGSRAVPVHREGKPATGGYHVTRGFLLR
jgi:hypothetical protein